MEIDLTKMSKEQELLLAEFQRSGLSADEFIKKYLAGKGIANPDEAVKEIDSTLSEIDRHYAEIKKAKEQGRDRKSYLRDVCNSVLGNADSKKAGLAVATVTNALEGKGSPESALEYDGIEAASLISDLDKAIENSTLAMLSGEDAQNE